MIKTQGNRTKSKKFLQRARMFLNKAKGERKKLILFVSMGFNSSRNNLGTFKRILIKYGCMILTGCE